MGETYRHYARAVFLCFLLISSSCSSARHQVRPSQEELYQSVSQRFISHDLDGAQAGAKQGWLTNPSSELGWRFKLKYAQILLFQKSVSETSAVLREPLPVEFSRLQPRYDYLNALLKSQQRDPAAHAALAAAIAEAHAKSDPESEVDGLLSLQAELKNDSDKQAALLKARDVAKQHRLDYQESRALNSLGLLALGQNRYAEAIDYLLPAISLAKRIKAIYVQAAATQNLGEGLFQLGDLGRALNPLQEAERLLPANDHSTVAVNIKNDLGQYYSLRKQDQDALRYYRQAFALAQKNSATSSSYILSSLNLATGLIQTQAIDEAEKYNEIASQAWQKALQLRVQIPPEWLAAIQVNRADIGAKRGQLDLAVKYYNDALQILHNEQPNFTQVLAYAGLAETQERLRNTREARKNFENALTSIETNRSRQVSAQYQIKFLSALIRFYQEYVEFLMRQHEPWAALAIADSSRGSVLTEGSASSRQKPGFESRLLTVAARYQTAFLFYSIAPRSSYLWALTPTGKAFTELNMSAAEIERDVSTYSSRIQAQRRDTRAEANQVGLRLYNTLIGPVASRLRRDMRVVIVPDGVLNNLNFETLLVPGIQPRYWLQDISLTVAPSLRILLKPDTREPVLNKALVIGDANYAGSEYPPLPESKREIAQVCARFPNGLTVLTQQQACPDGYKSVQPQRFSLIHFSAHVDADPQSPLDSAIILSPGQDGSRKLYARDFHNLKADLVTVSGCNSVGKNVLSGEGMVGFAWASFKAGARNAITSLWEVDDRSTTELMGRFYAGVTAGKPYAAALREAKLQMLDTLDKQPFYWAPFQLYSRDIGSGGRLALH